MSSFSQQTKRTDSLSLARNARGILQTISLPNTIGLKSGHLVSQVSAEMNSATFIDTEDCVWFFSFVSWFKILLENFHFCRKSLVKSPVTITKQTIGLGN
jgi:hypothetical protein